jgi:excisionase family DNA binding protein
MRHKPSAPALISPAAAARQLGIDVRRVRQAIQRKQLPAITIGNRRLIPAAAIERLIENY